MDISFGETPTPFDDNQSPRSLENSSSSQKFDEMYNNWYKNLPTFNNQRPRSLENFSLSQKFDDEEFKEGSASLITKEKFKKLKEKFDKLDINKKDLRSERIRERYKNGLFLIDKSITWERISEKYGDYELFPKQLHCDIFEQGYIGDCYFISIVSLISKYGELVTRLFPIKKNPFGYYEVILFLNGWKRVIIDDKIPFLKGEPLGTRAKKVKNVFILCYLKKHGLKLIKCIIIYLEDCVKMPLLF